MIYIHERMFAKAKTIIQQDLQMINKYSNKDNVIFFSLNNLLAQIETSYGNLTDAKHILLGIIKGLSHINPDHNNLVEYYYNLSTIYRIQGDFDSAVICIDKALNITELNRNKYHPFRIKLYSALASTRDGQGLQKEGKELFEKSQILLQESLIQNFTFLTESQKSDFYDVLAENYNQFLDFVSNNYHSFPDLIGQVFDMQSFVKGLLLNSTLNLKSIIQDRPDLKSVFNEWIDNKELLAKLVYGGSNSSGFKMDSIMEVSNTLEKQLSLKSNAFMQYINDRKFQGWQQIRSKLKDNEAFVMLIRLPYSQFGKMDSMVYCAVVLTREMKEHPALVMFPQSDRFDNEFYNAYLGKIKQGYNVDNEYTDLLSYQRFWKPVETYIKDKQNVYLLPEGVYHLINIGALQISPEVFLEDSHDFITIHSLSDFKTEPKNDERDINLVALFGDPEFDLLKQTQNSRNPEQIKRDDNRLINLPGTRNEVQALNSLFRQKKWQTRVFLSADATEKNLKSIKDPTILVISTHGFWVDDQPDSLKKWPNAGFQKNIQELRYSFIRPMLNSGLYLSGAQNTLDNTERKMFEQMMVY